MTDPTQTIEIKKSTRKTIGIMAGSILFVLAGISFINGAAAYRHGVFGIYLGWICCFFYNYTLLTSKPEVHDLI
jgi:hypothetical protein